MLDFSPKNINENNLNINNLKFAVNTLFVEVKDIKTKRGLTKMKNKFSNMHSYEWGVLDHLFFDPKILKKKDFFDTKNIKKFYF